MMSGTRRVAVVGKGAQATRHERLIVGGDLRRGARRPRARLRLQEVVGGRGEARDGREVAVVGLDLAPDREAEIRAGSCSDAR